jgi:hypothetical protein
MGLQGSCAEEVAEVASRITDAPALDAAHFGVEIPLHVEGERDDGDRVTPAQLL